MVDKTGAWFGDRSVPRGSNDHVNWNVHRDYVCHAAVVSLHGPQDPFPSLELKNKKIQYLTLFIILLENINILFNCYNSYLLLHITHWAHCSCLSSPKNIKKNQFYSIPYIVFNDCYLIVFLTWLIHFFFK